MSALASTYAIFYSWGRIHALLSGWEELLALAESPVTARGLIGHDAERPTAEVPRLAKQPGHHSDPMVFADLQADLERGVALLTSGGLGVEAVRALMAGRDLPGFARSQARPLHEVEAVYAATVSKLAQRLEPQCSAGGVR